MNYIEAGTKIHDRMNRLFEIGMTYDHASSTFRNHDLKISFMEIRHDEETKFNEKVNNVIVMIKRQITKELRRT